jgi:hypothetical protein
MLLIVLSGAVRAQQIGAIPPGINQVVHVGQWTGPIGNGYPILTIDRIEGNLVTGRIVNNWEYRTPGGMLKQGTKYTTFTGTINPDGSLTLASSNNSRYYVALRENRLVGRWYDLNDESKHWYPDGLKVNFSPL